MAEHHQSYMRAVFQWPPQNGGIPSGVPSKNTPNNRDGGTVSPSKSSHRFARIIGGFRLKGRRACPAGRCRPPASDSSPSRRRPAPGRSPEHLAGQMFAPFERCSKKMAMGHNLWRTILGRKNIYIPPILMFTRTFLGFDPQPYMGPPKISPTSPWERRVP